MTIELDVEPDVEPDAEPDIEPEVETCDTCGNDVDSCTCRDTCRECNDCSQWYDTEDSRLEFPEMYCRDCQGNFIQCDDCEDVVRRDLVSEVDQGHQWVCEDCLDHHYFWCESCDTYHADDRRSCVLGIHDYSYKPDPIFRFINNGREVAEYDTEPGRRPPYRIRGEQPHKHVSQHVFMGFELECEAEDADLGRGVDIMSQMVSEEIVYLKHDSSLDDGFEIVSHPGTLDYFHQLDLSALDKLRAVGFRSWNTDTCGIHVHVSRQAFTNKSHVYRFTKLLLDNQAHAQRVAGRKGSHWASFGESQRESMRTLTGKGGWPDRYCAVNLQNHATVEVRMFRGSLNVQRLLGNLELVDALVEYTRHMTLADIRQGRLDWARFAEWAIAARHGNRYNNLASLLSVTTRTNARVTGS